MITNAWRTVVSRPYDHFQLRDNNLLVCSDKEEKEIPLEQIREILFPSEKGSISLPLLIQLSKQNTKVLFCDQKSLPVCELNNLYCHYEAAGRLMDQCSWTKRRKDAIWRMIVKNKILMQVKHLEMYNIEIPVTMKQYYRTVESGDKTNREAVAARVYFDNLFGKEFERFASDNVNCALNYGYTILRSAFDRELSLHGYNTCIGIHHCSRQNRYNLSCDLMEPFRPFVDKIVKKNENRELDWDYKQEIIGLLYDECLYNNKKMEVATAIEYFSREVMEAMLIPRRKIGVVEFG